MEFKRLNKNSKLHFFVLNNTNIEQLAEHENEDTIILQIVQIDAIVHVVEYIPREKNALQIENCFERDIEFDNALDTIINNDPFGAKYSGKPIRCIFENGDNEWLDKALNLMHNEFIRKKLEYIVARGGYGKIKR